MMMMCQVPVFIAAVLLWLLPRDQTGGLLFALYAIPTFGGTHQVTIALTQANCAGYTKRTIFAAERFVRYCCGNIAGLL